ncbi:TDP-N-acetylfucosamine:lipid II N-acetylfucosaminyltransferase [Chitinophaga sp. NPDC101104]|uniref:TDP-N-acetylfucosamine:lipid II N-acetylfucosaminyltransferase n=1 Tax=Chitinophaga sp. NPDC101104 TaxID=3390561 RepID=UPI003D057834
MKYLHLINDSLFTNFVFELFEQVNPGQNEYLIGINDDSGKLRHSKSGENVHVRKIRSVGYYDFLQHAHYDVLIVHFLHDFKAVAINKLKKNPLLIWLAWGGDIHGALLSGKLYQPETDKIVRRLYPAWKRNVKSFLREVFYFFSTGATASTSYRKAVAKVDFCATVIPDEFDMLKENWDFFQAKQIPFAYATIEDNLRNIKSEDTVDGNSILIGNSIDATSNHLDVLLKLKQLNILDRHLILPMNYGEGLEYRAVVLEKGKEWFPQTFQPILQLMKPEDYASLLRKCNVAIMNHERQQAVGNLISLIWLGSKVFLSEKSPVYSFFRRSGINIFSFQSDLTAEALATALTAEEIRQNREKLRQIYSKVSVLQKAQTLVKTVNSAALEVK